jgi:hypothetical protein
MPNEFDNSRQHPSALSLPWATFYEIYDTIFCTRLSSPTVKGNCCFSRL